MSTKLHVTRCCGVGEIDMLSKSPTAEEAMIALYPQLMLGVAPAPPREYFGPHRPVIVTFTGVTERKVADHASGRGDDYGQAFALYLKKHGLGRVIRTGESKSWTGNTIRLWAWTVDYEALKEWAKEHIKVAA